MSNKKSEPKKIVVGLLVTAALFGAILGKAVPMKAGFSTLLKAKTEVEAEQPADSTSQSVRMSTNTTESVQKEQKIEKLSYGEQVNQDIQSEKFSGRLKVPLLLQTDDRWKNTSYGTGDGETILEKTGCAIVSLAMISSYLDNKEVSPQAVIDWAHNDYYIENQGTNWTIFGDYAAMKGYASEEVMTLASVEEHLTQGHPVIISVQPGLFTETGHIMVLTGYSDGKFWLNDPNDSTERKCSITQYTEEQLTSEALNYWAIYK